jgi:hypothetical protein
MPPEMRRIREPMEEEHRWAVTFLHNVEAHLSNLKAVHWHLDEPSASFQNVSLYDTPGCQSVSRGGFLLNGNSKNSNIVCHQNRYVLIKQYQKRSFLRSIDTWKYRYLGEYYTKWSDLLLSLDP